MTCNNSQAYTKKSPITQNLSPRYVSKVFPFSKKTISSQKIADPRKKQCLDFVVKTFENDDFFMLQDDSTLIMNLNN